MAKKVAKKKAVTKKKAAAPKRWFLKMSLDQEDGSNEICTGDPSKLKYHEDACDDMIDIVEMVVGSHIRKPGLIVELSTTVIHEGFNSKEMTDPVMLMKTAEGRQLIETALCQMTV